MCRTDTWHGGVHGGSGWTMDHICGRHEVVNERGEQLRGRGPRETKEVAGEVRRTDHRRLKFKEFVTHGVVLLRREGMSWPILMYPRSAGVFGEFPGGSHREGTFSRTWFNSVLWEAPFRGFIFLEVLALPSWCRPRLRMWSRLELFFLQNPYHPCSSQLPFLKVIKHVQLFSLRRAWRSNQGSRRRNLMSGSEEVQTFLTHDDSYPGLRGGACDDQRQQFVWEVPS